MQSPARVPEAHPWSRYVAMGDSFTEGIGDPDPTSPGGFRGWADRVAEELGRGQADFAYANLAVRGRLLQQIVDQQLAPCLALKPDLITLSAGGNDLIRPGGDPDALAEKLDSVVQILAMGGATVVLFNGPDTGSSVLGRIRSKVAIYNENLRTVAARHDAIIADMWSLKQLNDPQMWDEDRLHFSPLGHHTIAAMVLESLNVDHTLEPLRPKPCPPAHGGQPAPRTWCGPANTLSRGWCGGCGTAPPATGSRQNVRRRAPCSARASRWVRARAAGHRGRTALARPAHPARCPITCGCFAGAKRRGLIGQRGCGAG
ncbi:lipase/Acylhydrolase [Arthrobacter sp. Hiyo4]|nr:lipase/Acylhydrolase [Arthrobacter sp. Hiyo4]